MLVLIQGPAGGAKSQVAAEMLEAGEVQVLADTTALWAALSGVQRGPDGKYPVRQDDDPALAVALYVQAVAVRRGLEAGTDVGVTRRLGAARRPAGGVSRTVPARSS